MTFFFFLNQFCHFVLPFSLVVLHPEGGGGQTTTNVLLERTLFPLLAPNNAMKRQETVSGVEPEIKSPEEKKKKKSMVG